MSTKTQSILALVAAIGFVVLIAMQVIELNNYGKPGPESVIQAAAAAAPAAPAPAAAAAPTPAAATTDAAHAAK